MLQKREQAPKCAGKKEEKKIKEGWLGWEYNMVTWEIYTQILVGNLKRLLEDLRVGTYGRKILKWM
jgi:hypothetical protein